MSRKKTMADYHTFTSSRTTAPDLTALVQSLRATVDPTAGPRPPEGNTITVKIDTVWTPEKIAAAQTAIDTAPAFDAEAAEMDRKDLRALALGLWEAIPNPLLTKAQLRARIIAIRKTL